MAISSGDWSSSSDPYLEAAAIAYTGTVGELSNSRIKIEGAEGFFHGIVDKDVQELFWSNDADRNKTWPVNAISRAATYFYTGYEYGSYEENTGGSFQQWNPREFKGFDPSDVYVYVTGKSAGSVSYSLYAYTAYMWVDKDPAQVIFSWCSYYVQSALFSSFKQFLNQQSFQDASDFYDLVPCGLHVYREAGVTIAEQIKRVMDHTADMIAIRPDPADGAVELFMLPRRALAERTTAIELDSISVADYTIRPTDRYTLDKVITNFGPLVYWYVNGSALAPSPEYYNTTHPPTDLPTTNRTQHVQKFGDTLENRSVEIDCPYTMYRHQLIAHHDLGFWSQDQEEIEIGFRDWSHLNFEVGDLVHVVGRGFDGTENFVVTEKFLDLDNLTARCTLLRFRGIDGMAPIASSDPLALSLTPNGLGYFEDGDKAATSNPQIIFNDAPRNFDRWWDESGRWCHATQFNRGTGGPSGANPGSPPMYRNNVNRMPALYFEAEQGLMLERDTTNDFSGGIYTVPSGAADFTAYFVINPSNALGGSGYQYLFHQNGSAQLIFSITNGAGGSSVMGYYDGSWHGTATPTNGWQILVFVLSGTSGGSIRRNGVTLNSGLGYTPVALAVTDDVGIGMGSGGNAAGFEGMIAEVNIFHGAQDAATIAAIEAHLAEKYAISI